MPKGVIAYIAAITVAAFLAMLCEGREPPTDRELLEEINTKIDTITFYMETTSNGFNLRP